MIPDEKRQTILLLAKEGVNEKKGTVSLFPVSGFAGEESKLMGWSVPLPYGIAMCQNRRVRKG